MARDMVEKTIVALFHLTRVAFVFITTPLLLAAIEGQEAVAGSNQLLKTIPGVFDLKFEQGIFFVLMAVGDVYWPCSHAYQYRICLVRFY